MSHEKGIEAAARAIVRNGIGELDIDQWAAESRNTFKIQAEGAIKAYLDASGMVMVPKEPTKEMHNEWEEGYYKGFNDLPDSYELMNRDSAFHCFTTAHHAMIAAAPNPFQTPEESRE